MTTHYKSICILLCSLFVASHSVVDTTPIWSDDFGSGSNTKGWTIYRDALRGIDVWNNNNYTGENRCPPLPSGAEYCLQLTSPENVGAGGWVTLSKTKSFGATRYSSVSYSITLELYGFINGATFKIGYKCLPTSSSFEYTEYKGAASDGTHTLVVNSMLNCDSTTAGVTISMMAFSLIWDSQSTPDRLTVVGITDFQLTGTEYVSTSAPTSAPTQGTAPPTALPTDAPSFVPTSVPTNAPSNAPSVNCRSCLKTCHDAKKDCQLIDPKVKCNGEYDACRELCDYNCEKL